MFHDCKELMNKVAVNARYALLSEIELRNRIESLQEPWYGNLLNIVSIGASILGLIALVLILVKIGVIALIFDTLLTCFRQCCKLGKQARTLAGQNIQTESDEESGIEECNRNEAKSSEDFSIEGELIPVTTFNETEIARRAIPRHMAGKTFNYKACNETANP